MLEQSPAQQETDQKKSGNTRTLPCGKKVPTNGKIWKKGQSGNPRGRPKKDLDLAKEAQKHAMKAIQALADIVADTEAPPPSRISAASELLDRGFGRAPQHIDMKHTVGLSEEFEAFIRRLNGHAEPPRQLEADVIDGDYEDVED